MSEAEQLESPFGVIDYGVTEKQLKQLAARFSNITAIDDRESYDDAMKALRELVSARTTIEARRQALKKESLAFGRLVDSTAKQLFAVTESEEQRIRSLIDEVKAQKAAEQAERERIEQERIDAIKERIQAVVLLPGTLQRATSAEVLAARDELEQLVIDESFEEFIEQAAEAKTAVIEQLNELYAGALHDEKIAEEERKRKEAEDAARAAEDARLKAEREELEAKQRAINEENQRIAAEQAERQAKIDAENERKARELREEQEVLAAERQAIEDEKREEAERIERERLAQEQAEAEAKAEQERKERAERLRPDKEKIIKHADELASIVSPKMQSSEGEDLMANSAKQLGELCRWITTQAHKL